MSEREMLIDQAMQTFVQGHRAGTISSIAEFIQAYPSSLHAALLDLIEEFLYVEAEIATADADPEILAAVDAAYEDVVHQLSSRPLSLLELRKERGLLPSKIARQVNVPPDLWGRLERGAIIAASIPAKLVARLADALQRTQEEIWLALQAPAHVQTGVRLSAVDDSKVTIEPPIDFVEALQHSAGLTPEITADWLNHRSDQGE